jgi:hypothetical protein
MLGAFDGPASGGPGGATGGNGLQRPGGGARYDAPRGDGGQRIGALSAVLRVVLKLDRYLTPKLLTSHRQGAERRWAAGAGCARDNVSASSGGAGCSALGSREHVGAECSPARARAARRAAVRAATARSFETAALLPSEVCGACLYLHDLIASGGY